jgi:peptidoglycan/xylan/chitin deacetylase (PgdA/CDA1 family)
MVIISIDVDAGSPELGRINKGYNDLNVNRRKTEIEVGEIDRLALPIFLDFFDQVEVPATFALRGQLTEIEDSGIDRLLKSSVKHDIGAHGYYHQKFKYLPLREAENYLQLISEGFKCFGIVPRSFVFPANIVNHLDLLETFGYECYRGIGGLTKDTMGLKKNGNLVNVCPSFYLQKNTSPAIIMKIIDLAVSRKLPFHMWFHLWNMGQKKPEIEMNLRRLLLPVLLYAKEIERNGNLTFETMLSAAKTVV